MARVLAEGAGGQLSGKLNGVVYSRNRNGLYVRNYAKPVMPNSAKQMVARDDFQAASKAWQLELQEVERQNWNAWAKTFTVPRASGGVQQLTGFQAFLALTAKSKVAGLQFYSDAPGVPGLAAPDPGFGVTLPTKSSCKITFEGAWASDAACAMIVYQSRPMPSHRAFLPRDFRVAKVIEGAATPPTSPYTIASLPWDTADSVCKYIIRCCIVGPVEGWSPFQEVEVQAVAS